MFSKTNNPQSDGTNNQGHAAPAEAATTDTMDTTTTAIPMEHSCTRYQLQQGRAYYSEQQGQVMGTPLSQMTFEQLNIPRTTQIPSMIMPITSKPVDYTIFLVFDCTYLRAFAAFLRNSSPPIDGSSLCLTCYSPVNHLTSR